MSRPPTGGRGEAGRWLGRESLDAGALARETGDPGSGALVTFAGTVRDDRSTREVTAITYTAHEPLAARVLCELESEAVTAHGAMRCRVRHRLGRVPVGEASVIVAVRAAHRGDAFAACRAVIDALKERAPIWKEEHFADGSSGRPDGVPLREGSRAGDAGGDHA